MENVSHSDLITIIKKNLEDQLKKIKARKKAYPIFEVEWEMLDKIENELIESFFQIGHDVNEKNYEHLKTERSMKGVH